MLCNTMIDQQYSIPIKCPYKLYVTKIDCHGLIIGCELWCDRLSFSETVGGRYDSPRIAELQH